jgi:hypothetical protein
MSKYNGWTNYATWRVNLEFFDDNNYFDTDYRCADDCRQFVESYIEETSEGIARDYALAFTSDVNWDEIYEHHKEEGAE